VRTRLLAAGLLASIVVACPDAADAQSAPARQAPVARAAPPAERLGIQAFGMAGVSFFTAAQTFEAIVGTSRAPIFGGGLRVTIPGGAYAEVGAWRFSKDGERAFVDENKRVLPLGIPTTATMTPLEITAGWRYRGLGPSVTPHVGAGFTSLRYEEVSDFAENGENVSDRFSGFHVVGGTEVRLSRWIGLAGDVVWTSVADAIGNGGVSEAFGEDNLGGTSIRLKLLLGR
jgi:hypothetical protein